MEMGEQPVGENRSPKYFLEHKHRYKHFDNNEIAKRTSQYLKYEFHFLGQRTVIR